MELPKNLASLYENARENYENKEYDRALKQLNEALNIEPNYAEAMILLVLIHSFLEFQKMSKDKALKIIERALNLKFESSIIWYYLGRFYMNLKDYKKAIECNNRSIEIDPQFKKAYLNLGAIYTFPELKDYEKALEFYNKSIEIDPQYKKAYFDMGWIYNELKDYEKAIEFYSKSIEIDPQFKEAYKNLAHVYAQSGNFKKVVEISQRLLEIDPDFAELFTPKDKSFINDLSLETVEHALKSSENVYRKLRNIQSTIIKLAKKNPNNIFIQKLSKFDLSNISKINLEIEEVGNKQIKDVLIILQNVLKTRNIASFIPWEIILKIKETTIDLGVKYPRLQIQEIAEKCGSPQDCVIVVIKEMIEMAEIYADYFESTQFVVFDQKANLDETENIRRKFEVWEKTTCKNCGMKILETNQKICEYCGLDF